MLGILAMIAMAHPQSCCGPTDMTAFLSDPDFIATHLAPLPLRYVPVQGHMVGFKASQGGAHAFYVPPAKGARAAIVMVHEYWGLNDYMKREAERLHDRTGYAVLAVDMYDGKVTADPQEAGKFMGAVDTGRGKAIVRGAVVALKNGSLGWKPARIGTIGFCFGGGWSFQTAVQGGKNVNACVIFYGLPDTSSAAISSLQAPVLMVHATRDKWINQDVVDRFTTAMKQGHKQLTVLHYDADHAFANPSNPHYDKKDADDAMNHAIALYKKYL